MQRVGEFLLGESYYYHELAEMFSSLTLLKDQAARAKAAAYVGITETHLLGFRELPDRRTRAALSPLRHRRSLLAKEERQPEEESEATYYKLRLVFSAELQCIESIHYREAERSVRLTLKKYKAIKLYHESEDISKQYKFLRPEVFLRGVLKYITKFQPCEVLFEPFFPEQKKARRSTLSAEGGREEGGREEESLQLLIAAAGRLEEEVGRERGGEQRAKISSLNKLYQKIIEYYSARANPYYLIFVNKLNSIYHKYYLAPNDSPHPPPPPHLHPHLHPPPPPPPQ